MKLLLPFLGSAFAAPLSHPIAPVKIVETVQPITPFGNIDPMMMMLLLDDDDNSDSSTDKLLPLMMLQNGQFAGANGQMNPLMMIALLDDDSCTVNAEVKKFTKLTSTQQKQIARGEYFFKGTDPSLQADLTVAGDLLQAPITAATTAERDEINKYIDYNFISCEEKSKKSNFKDLLPLMLMGQNNMHTMDPTMLMLMLDDDDNDLSLPLLMGMNGIGGTGTSPNPLMWLAFVDDDKLSEEQCDSKYKLSTFFEWTANTGNWDLAKKTTGIRAAVKGLTDATYGSNTWLVNYKKCLTDATVEKTDKLKSLLPLMMVNQGGFGGVNGQMDPLMMMLLLDDDDNNNDNDNLLPFLMMQNGGFGTGINGQMDPLMMALLLKDD